MKVTPSSGNVFRDLWFSAEEAERLLIRADLLIKVRKLIASRRLKQAEVAKLLRVSQSRVGDLVRGRSDLFSTDTLIDTLTRLGARVRLVLEPIRRPSMSAESGVVSATITRKTAQRRGGSARSA